MWIVLAYKEYIKDNNHFLINELFLIQKTTSRKFFEYEEPLTRDETNKVLLMQFLDKIHSSKFFYGVFSSFLNNSMRHNIRKHFLWRHVRKFTNLSKTLFIQSNAVDGFNCSKSFQDPCFVCVFNCSPVDNRRFSGVERSIFLWEQLEPLLAWNHKFQQNNFQAKYHGDFPDKQDNALLTTPSLFQFIFKAFVEHKHLLQVFRWCQEDIKKIAFCCSTRGSGKSSCNKNDVESFELISVSSGQSLQKFDAKKHGDYFFKVHININSNYFAWS